MTAAGLSDAGACAPPAAESAVSPSATIAAAYLAVDTVPPPCAVFNGGPSLWDKVHGGQRFTLPTEREGNAPLCARHDGRDAEARRRRWGSVERLSASRAMSVHDAANGRASACTDTGKEQTDFVRQGIVSSCTPVA